MIRSAVLLSCFLLSIASCSKKEPPTAAQLDAEIKVAEKEFNAAGKTYDEVHKAFEAARGTPDFEKEQTKIGEAGVKLEQAEVKVRTLKAERAAMAP